MASSPPNEPDDPFAEPARGRGQRLAEHHSPTVMSDTPSSASGGYPSSPASGGSSSSGISGMSGIDTVPLSASFRERYQIIRVLGKGGFGTVYLAHDRTLDQQVAVKVMTTSAATPNELKRFIFEARTSAKLRHANIVNVFDITQDGEKLQLVMEYYPGGSLSQLLKEQGAMKPLEALDYIRQIAIGLGFAHRKGIIHRDIKPANIFLAGEGIVKLGDFGIAAQSETHEHTATGEVMGSPLYMSPEQTRDSKNIDGRSDLYSLGLTLYHMLTGKPPRVLEIERLPPAFAPLLRAATNFELEERVQTADDFVALVDCAIAELRAGGTGTHVIPGGAVGPTHDPSSQSNISATHTAPPPQAVTTPPVAVPNGVQSAGARYGGGAAQTWPPGYAGPDEATMTAPAPPPAPAANPMRAVIVSIFVLVFVMIAGFITVIGMIKKNERPTVVVVPESERNSPERRRPKPPAGDGEQDAKEAREAMRERREAMKEREEGKEREKEIAAADPAATEPPPAPATPEPAAATPAPTPASAAEPPPAAPVEPPPADGRPFRPRFQPGDSKGAVDDAVERLRKSQRTGGVASKDGMKAFKEWMEDPENPRLSFALLRARGQLEEATKREPENPLYWYQWARLNQEIAFVKSRPRVGLYDEALEAGKIAVEAYEKALALAGDRKDPEIKDAKERLSKTRETLARIESESKK